MHTNVNILTILWKTGGTGALSTCVFWEAAIGFIEIVKGRVDPFINDQITLPYSFIQAGLYKY